MSRTFSADNSTGAARLLALANNPDVTLDVTNLDLSRLPPHVKAHIRSEAKAFSAPVLQTARGIAALNAMSFDAPQLQTSGKIYVPDATSFDVAQLQTAGDIHADSAMSFRAPQLRVSGHISADSATRFDAPLLQASEDIVARRAKSFSAPQLQTPGRIYLPKRSFSRPARPASGAASPAAVKRAP